MSDAELSTAIEQYAANPDARAADSAAAANPLHLVQDRLQNRWKWVLLTGVVLGPLLAFVAYKAAPVKWESVGYIQVDSSLKPLVDPTMETTRLDDFAGFISSRAVLLKSDRILEMVVRAARDGKPISGASTAAGRNPTNDIQIVQRYLANFQDDALAVAEIRTGLSADVPRGSSTINVGFSSNNPDITAPIVNLVFDAFMHSHGPDSDTTYTEGKAQIGGQVTHIRSMIEARETDRAAVIKDADLAAVDPARDLELRQEKMRSLDGRLDAIAALQRKIERQYREGKISESPDAVAPSVPEVVPPATMFEPTTTELEQLDPRLAQIRADVVDHRVLLSIARQRYKPSHPALEKISIELQGKENLLAAARAGSLQAWREGAGSTQSYGALTRESADLNADKEALSASIDRVQQVVMRVAKIDRDIAGYQAEFDLLSERLRELEREADPIRRGRVNIMQGASRRGEPASDKRTQLAAVGFVGGFIIAFGAFFVLGSVDPRAFSVSQLQKDSKSGRWLGVVPDMTSAASDAETKSLATNCVHRIRNKIEARRQQGTGYAIMVTSPFQGDGKTTVAVALALSYAESGHNTLLVDCDFIGRSLSHQFERLRAPGVCEVLRRGSVADEVTSIRAHLSILPVGSDPNFSANNVQVGSMRRLFRALREKYDIVIVDSGPVTASVEAIPVASSCDGAVLAIRRGRSRARLPEAVQELTDTGIDYLGLVLNYADAEDCRRYGSISRMSAEVSRALSGSSASVSRHPLLASDTAQQRERGTS